MSEERSHKGLLPNMSEELETTEDPEVYEDFTTATDWERFTAALEEVFREWKLQDNTNVATLQKGELSMGVWEQLADTITAAEETFLLTHFWLKSSDQSGDNLISPTQNPIDSSLPIAFADMMATENDFPPRAHHLCRWYGLRSFVVLSLAGHNIVSESMAKLILSSISMAVSNTNSCIPVFFQLHRKEDMYYVGVCEGGGIHMDYEMVSLNFVPSYCTHLSGLLNVFKSKVGPTCTMTPSRVSARFTYILNDWTRYSWTQEPPDIDPSNQTTLKRLKKPPLGAYADPISELQLYASWPNLSEDLVVDSESYSDFDPLNAPNWVIRIQMNPEVPCYLSEFIDEIVNISKRNDSMEQLLGRKLLDDNEDEILFANALGKLTETPSVLRWSPSVQTPSNPKKKQKRKHPEVGPMAQELLNPILFILFPDAEENDQKYPYNIDSPDSSESEKFASNLKTCSVDGLVWRLAVLFGHCISNLGGPKAAAHLWHEMVLELRFRWENSILIPGLEHGSPNLASCLLQQKLQMLNCCIEKKRAREESNKSTPHNEKPDSKSDDSSSEEDEEEFFECTDEVTDVLTRPKKKLAALSLWNQPEGRRRRCGSLSLIETGEAVYIPHTQEPAPMTEDQLEELAEVLVRLGSDGEGSELRARMMSASLLSDMQAFKAANPRCQMEDFVCWYSPRDWIEGNETDEYGQKKGHLSPRMTLPGNVWQDVWSSAKPVPAKRQKRLFDDTREAEKVLHFLASNDLGSVANLLLPALCHSALVCLNNHSTVVQQIPSWVKKMNALVPKIIKGTRIRNPDPRVYEDIIRDIHYLEATISEIESLESKFLVNGMEEEQHSDMKKFILQLIEDPEVPVVGAARGPVGRILRDMFLHAQKAARMLMETDASPEISSEPLNSHRSGEFPRPLAKEFLLRTMAPRPTPYSTSSPQRLLAVIMKRNIRLCGAFAHDMVFQ